MMAPVATARTPVRPRLSFASLSSESAVRSAVTAAFLSSSVGVFCFVESLIGSPICRSGERWERPFPCLISPPGNTHVIAGRKVDDQRRNTTAAELAGGATGRPEASSTGSGRNWDGLVLLTTAARQVGGRSAHRSPGRE